MPVARVDQRPVSPNGPRDDSQGEQRHRDHPYHGGRSCFGSLLASDKWTWSSGRTRTNRPLEIVLLTMLHCIHLLLCSLDIHLVVTHLADDFDMTQRFTKSMVEQLDKVNREFKRVTTARRKKRNWEKKS